VTNTLAYRYATSNQYVALMAPECFRKYTNHLYTTFPILLHNICN
jgi:hypothetical protein